jgi:hypothetical protein
MSHFRWIAAIALWTLVAGPIFNGPGSRQFASGGRSSAKSALRPISVNQERRTRSVQHLDRPALGGSSCSLLPPG